MKKSYDQPREHIKKQRHYFADKVCLVKAMVFPEVMYGCESWTIKNAECQRTDAFELWCWRRLLRVPWTARSLCLLHCQVDSSPLSHQGSPCLFIFLPHWTYTSFLGVLLKSVSSGVWEIDVGLRYPISMQISKNRVTYILEEHTHKTVTLKGDKRWNGVAAGEMFFK